MALRINPKSPLLKEKQDRAAQLPVYDTKAAATKAAVQKYKAGQKESFEVWKSPNGKFVVAPYQVWEDLYQLGYDRAVDSFEIYDIAIGRIDEIEEV